MKSASLIRARWLPLIFVPLLALTVLDASAQLSSKPGEYGKHLRLDVVLPPSQLDKFSNFRPSKPANGDSPMLAVLTADTVDWVGESLVADSTTNPYTMVVSIEGTAKADGDVATMWRSGWRLEDGSTKSTALPGLSKSGVKAGEHVTLTRAAAPSRFDRDKNVAPVLSLVRADNLDIDHVQVQLWSGVGSPSGVQWILSSRFLLIGVVMLVVALVFRKL
jgi:hypothetical protein